MWPGPRTVRNPQGGEVESGDPARRVRLDGETQPWRARCGLCSYVNGWPSHHEEDTHTRAHTRAHTHTHAKQTSVAHRLCVDAQTGAERGFPSGEKGISESSGNKESWPINSLSAFASHPCTQTSFTALLNPEVAA